MAATEVTTNLLRRRLVDISLNVAFAAWVVYFVATGSIIPTPLLRDAPQAPRAELLDPAPPMPLPQVEVLQEES